MQQVGEVQQDAGLLGENTFGEALLDAQPDILKSQCQSLSSRDSAGDRGSANEHGNLWGARQDSRTQAGMWLKSEVCSRSVESVQDGSVNGRHRVYLGARRTQTETFIARSRLGRLFALYICISCEKTLAIRLNDRVVFLQEWHVRRLKSQDSAIFDT